MAGHSKWANIQHRKGKVDAQRGKIFTKLVKELTVAARMGGGDIDGNPRLRAAVNAAKAQSMPNDNIKRAIDKGLGKGEGVDLEELIYEGYGPGGVAILVAATTDHKGRTTPEIRHLFSKHGGNMGEAGSVAWQFSKKGFITMPKQDKSEDDLTEILIEIGAEDYEDLEESWGIYTAFDDLHVISDRLEKMGLSIESAKMVMVPQNEMQITGETLQKVMKLIDLFQDHDDVQDVWSNADFDESELA
ncbi:MAG: YebC/PmpR family DNA-binding transcriptional regulator [Acidobacteria bacterium]|nr:YebC/PmpR family DNA-binding transcriptional regulator [Acidobacteriota bacterium]